MGDGETAKIRFNLFRTAKSFAGTFGPMTGEAPVLEKK
jgi:hypothetical protein